MTMVQEDLDETAQGDRRPKFNREFQRPALTDDCRSEKPDDHPDDTTDQNGLGASETTFVANRSMKPKRFHALSIPRLPDTR